MDAGLLSAATVRFLTQTALERADATVTAAEHWLALATLLNERLAEPDQLHGDLHYAQARLYTQHGQLPLAETALRAAQTAWQQRGDTAALARSNLGLTQVLAMQGRHAEAEAVARSGVRALEATAAADASTAHLLAVAHRNLATVLVYQERHLAALVSYGRAQQVLEAELALPDLPSRAAEAVRSELGHLHLNQASAQMFLD